MNTSNMKNIVILKDLPSNLVEEAIIFLKENQKLKKLEPIDIDTKQVKSNKEKKEKNTKDYIINEAQMLVAEYVKKIENKDKREEVSYRKLKKKCEFLKKMSIALSVTIAVLVMILCTGIS